MPPDFVPPAHEITAYYAAGTAAEVTLHDGSVVRFTKIPEGYDPGDRDAVVTYVRRQKTAGNVPTGLLFLDPNCSDMHAAARTTKKPLAQLPYESLCPGARALDALQAAYR